MPANHNTTRGFGVPDVESPHHFVVTIGTPTRIIEHLGGTVPESIPRAEVSSDKWRMIYRPVERVFNARLKSHGLEPSAWEVGDNPVDRLLGKELCVLAWAIEYLDDQQVHTAIRNWLALVPEDRWWLFDRAATSTGWRIALRYALT